MTRSRHGMFGRRFSTLKALFSAPAEFGFEIGHRDEKYGDPPRIFRAKLGTFPSVEQFILDRLRKFSAEFRATNVDEFKFSAQFLKDDIKKIVGTSREKNKPRFLNARNPLNGIVQVIQGVRSHIMWHFMPIRAISPANWKAMFGDLEQFPEAAMAGDFEAYWPDNLEEISAAFNRAIGRTLKSSVTVFYAPNMIWFEVERGSFVIAFGGVNGEGEYECVCIPGYTG